MRVIGTAGHVDHGKTMLVTALTGMNPDRLKEERERLMTIDLGFAWFTLPSGEEIGIVDVPGHRDFIGNMLAGVGGLDAALLIIAADEGVMPQTREHVAILDLLQIRQLIVVLTKIDLVDDPEWLDLLEDEIRDFLKNTGYKDALILRSSSYTKQGIPELLQALDAALQSEPRRPDLGRPRLPIDRVFSISGFGTIVTGTISDGKLSIGDEVEILPRGIRARIRGLETHKKKIKTAIPGSRLAINLSGVEIDQVTRGQVLTLPGTYSATHCLDVHVRMLPDAVSPLQHRSEVKLFTGTSETMANLRLLGKETLSPGEHGWLQLELKTPIVAVRGDHFIIRRPSPEETLGGGIIVDPNPKKRHKRFDLTVIKSLETMEKGSPKELLLQTCTILGPAPIKDVVLYSGLEEGLARSAVNELMENNQLLLLDDFVIEASKWKKMMESVIEVLGKYHELFPLRRGMPREELKSRLRYPTRFFNLVMGRLSFEKTIKDANRWIALKNHEIRFSANQKEAVDKLNDRFSAAPFAPPSIHECEALVGEEVFSAILDSGLLVPVSKDIIFRKTDYEIMVEKIRNLLRQKGKISMAEVRDLFSTSRRYIQALLEHLDSIGITNRVGDYRILKEDTSLLQSGKIH